MGLPWTWELTSWLEHEFVACDTVAERGLRGHVEVEIAALASLFKV